MASNDEPLNVIYITSSYPQETYVYDGLKASKINVLMNGEVQEVKVNVGDYVEVKNYQHDDPAVHEWANDPQSNGSVWYVYTANKTWLYAGAFTGIDSVESGKKFISGWCKNIYNCSGNNQHYLRSVDAHLTEDQIIGNTENTIVSVADGWSGHDSIEINDYDPNFIEYGVDTYYYTPERTEPSPKTTQAQIGDYAELSYWDEELDDYIYSTHVYYQYPGVWVPYGKYPDLNVSPILPVKPHVQIKWTDPQDITDWKPTPATWEGTVIVRKENTPPLHRWDGTKVVRSTTRDEYKTNAYKDEDVKTGKVYYYGFFPYYTKFPDPDHPIRFYTFTKYIRVETGVVSYAPVINSIETNADTATINYTIIAPTSMGYATAKLYGKIGSNPACDETDDIMLVVDQTKEEIEVTDLLYDTQYNFCIQVTDNTGEALTSNVVSTTSGEDPVPPEYDYVKRAGTYNVRVIDALHGEHYYDLTEVPFIWNVNKLNNPFNKNLPFTLYYPGEQFYNWYYSTITGIRFYDTATINLTKESNDSYTASYTGFNYKQGIFLNNGYNYVNSHGWYFESEIGDYLYVSDWSEQTQPATMTTSFNNLSEALIYIEQHFRHVNVYVDGICWVRAI